MKDKLLVGAIVLIIILGLGTYLKNVFDTSPIEYAKEEDSPAQRVENSNSNTLLAEVFVEQSDELSLLDTLDELSGDTMTERFFAYYDARIGLDTENVAVGTRQEVLFDFLEQENITELLNDFKKYDQKDLTIVPAIENARKNYQNSFESSVTLYVNPDNLENELTIFRRAQSLGTNDEKRSEIRNLNAIKESYRSLQKSFIAISVPSDATEIHLKLINSIGLIIDRIEGMEKLVEDPLLARIYASAYEEQASVFIDAYKSLEEYFKN
ncbi:MAG: hypothetical protein MRY49_02445 [Candidatus Pacebacteria bacterium]|nr:hypothetical protein [Candidatus Paceibacterota bacterium]